MEKPPDRLGQRNGSAVWDCASSLYDSFELNLMQRQLDSALSSRSLSMPHLSGDDRRPRIQLIVSETAPLPSSVSRTLLKLLRSVFKTRPICTGSIGVRDERVHDKHSCLLATKPEEAQELPEIGAFMRRTASAATSRYLL